MTVDADGFQVYKGEKRELAMDEKKDRAQRRSAPHMANFLAACRSRRHQDLHARCRRSA